MRDLCNLSAYNFKVEYVKGHKNIVADMMSRNPVWPAEHSDDKDRELCQVLNTMSDSKDPLLDPLVKAALEDEDYQSLLKAI